MSDFLHQKQREIIARLNELKPAIDEYARLEAAAAVLGSFDTADAPASSPGTSDTPPARRPGRPRGSKKRASKPAAKTTTTSTPAKPAPKKAGARKSRGGRPKGSGKRAGETVAVIQGQPGVTIPEIATKLGIKANYLYRVLPVLEKEGQIEKKGRGWHPKG